MPASSQPSPRDLGLTSSSFSTPKILTKHSAIINVQAPQKVGKTYWGLDVPGPIVVMNHDNGLRGVVEYFLKKGKSIIVAGMKREDNAGYPSYQFAPPLPQSKEKRKDIEYLSRIKRLALPIWEKTIEDYQEALESKARSIVIDTGGAWFNLGKFAFMGMTKYTSKDDPYGQKSGEMKSIFQGLITEAYSYDKNVIWLHRVKEAWAGGQPTGKFEADGYKQLPYEVEMTVKLSKRQVLKTDEDGEKSKVWERRAEIGDCRINDKMNGLTFDGKEATFAEIMAQAYPKTEVEDWQ